MKKIKELNEHQARWFAGIIDNFGNFKVRYRKRKKGHDIDYSLIIDHKNRNLLGQIQRTLGVGCICENKGGVKIGRKFRYYWKVDSNYCVYNILKFTMKYMRNTIEAQKVFNYIETYINTVIMERDRPHMIGLIKKEYDKKRYEERKTKEKI